MKCDNCVKCQYGYKAISQNGEVYICKHPQFKDSALIPLDSYFNDHIQPPKWCPLNQGD